jgi:hypothetical protein
LAHFVSVIVGEFAVLTAIGAGGSTEESSGVIGIIAQQPFGLLLVGLTALGLRGYVISVAAVRPGRSD